MMHVLISYLVYNNHQLLSDCNITLSEIAQEIILEGHKMASPLNWVWQPQIWTSCQGFYP